MPRRHAWFVGVLRLALAGTCLCAGAARASFHTFAIESLYSNADGSVQYVVLHESQGQFGMDHWTGQVLTSTHGTTVKTFTFPSDLPAPTTADKRVLAGSNGFAALSLVVPDYVFPDRFLPTDGGTLSYAGVDQVTYGPLPADGINALTRTGASTPNLAINFSGASATVPAIAVGAIEFYNAALDHYFISDLAPDLDALDSGRISGWARTGQSFKVYPSAASGGAGVSPVCRFYIPPQHGNSHFFSASPAECSSVLQKVATDPNFSGYVLETPSAFFIALPNTTSGACPSATIPVYRMWNQRADSNHRYTTDTTTKAQMLTKGYVAEGYGPNAVIMCAPTPGIASIQFTSISGELNGALVNDASNTPAVNDQAYSTSTDRVTVGPRNGPGEAIGFSKFRAPTLIPVTWTSATGDQLVGLPLGAEIAVPLTIWVVAGPFATTQLTALTLLQTAQQLYADERMGVRFSTVEIVDATASAQAGSWNAFTCGPANANVAAIGADIGTRAGRLNAYLVNLVDGSTARGNACAIGGSFVAVAAGSGADVLAHELGHDFALEHIDDLTADFNSTNIMHSASSTRQFFTEGQTFRAHLRSASAINALLNARPGQVTRDCDRDTLTLQCPAIRKRVWADGAFPAN